MRRGNGMTRLELLVVILALILLTAVIVPGLGRQHGRLRAICGTNLSSVYKSLAIYAAGYNDQLPLLPGANGTQWLSDESPQLAPLLIGAGLEGSGSKIFYCPDNHGQDPAQLSAWNGISVWGYAFLNDRGPAATNLGRDFPVRKAPDTPPLRYTALLNQPNSADIELGMDWIVSDSPDATHAHFTGLKRPGSPALTYSTSHLASANKPAGGNVLYLDGSVKWRSFGPKAAVAIKQSGPTPMYFWVPAAQ